MKMVWKLQLVQKAAGRSHVFFASYIVCLLVSGLNSKVLGLAFKVVNQGQMDALICLWITTHGL